MFCSYSHALKDLISVAFIFEKFMVVCDDLQKEVPKKFLKTFKFFNILFRKPLIQS